MLSDIILYYNPDIILCFCQRGCINEYIFFQVSNLEKAGILNKTKVSENGKKIR